MFVHIKWHDINKVPSKWSVPSRVTILSHIHTTLRLSISKIISQANRVEHTGSCGLPSQWILKWQDRLSSKQVVKLSTSFLHQRGVIHPPPASFSPLMIIPSSFLPSFLSFSLSLFLSSLHPSFPSSFLPFILPAMASVWVFSKAETGTRNWEQAA